MMRFARVACVLISLAVALSGSRASAVIFDWVNIGQALNPADDTGFGAVPYAYRISRIEVTNAQYAEFLNAVAASDPNALYNPEMASSSTGGIERSGSEGSFTYATKAGMAGKPVVFVSYYDVLRFVNWLHNEQPTGAQGVSTTEDGAYTMIAEDLVAGSECISRSLRARFFLPSEDEWYKAAYYDPFSASYFEYPTGTDLETACAVPDEDAGNQANCQSVNGGLTDVGAYRLSASPYGLFDQGGNVWEWNEALVSPGWPCGRGRRGGALNSNPVTTMRASVRRGGHSPIYEEYHLGFRIARTPPPQACGLPGPETVLLLMTGLLMFSRRSRR